MQLTERPYSYNFSKNEIRYVFRVADATAPGLQVQVQLMYRATSGSAFTALIVLPLRPTADNKVHVYIQGYLNSLLDWVLPGISDTITNGSKQACHYYLQFREITDAIPNPDWIDDELANYRIVLKGGIESHKSSRNNFFVNHFDTALSFLTWLPADRFMYYDEKVFLSFLNRTGVGFILKFNVHATDGTAGAFSTTYAGDNDLIYHVSINPTTLDLSSYVGGKDVYWFSMWVVADDGDDTPITNSYKFYIEYRPRYVSYPLAYHNSIGGMDSACVIGDTDISNDRSYDEAEEGLNLNEWTSEKKSHGTRQPNILLQRNYKGDVGFIRTKALQEAYNELLASKSIYMRFNTIWVPVNIITKALRLGTRKDDIFSFPLEWQLTEKEEVFTPEDIDFGAGTNTEAIYNYPLNFRITNTQPDTPTADHTTVTMVWDPADPLPVSYVLKVVNTTDTTTTTYPLSVLTYDFVADDTKEYEFSIKSVYAGGDSIYSPIIVIE